MNLIGFFFQKGESLEITITQKKFSADGSTEGK